LYLSPVSYTATGGPAAAATARVQVPTPKEPLADGRCRADDFAAKHASVHALRLRCNHMNAPDMSTELQLLHKQFGSHPMSFFWILGESANENLDFKKQNDRWAYIKDESWHSLDLTKFQLWAISDNGDLLWWNGDEQTIAMRPRDMRFISLATRPSRFIGALASGKTTFAYFPSNFSGNSDAPEAH
jgi:hypothetical protein